MDRAHRTAGRPSGRGNPSHGEVDLGGTPSSWGKAGRSNRPSTLGHRDCSLAQSGQRCPVNRDGRGSQSRLRRRADPVKNSWTRRGPRSASPHVEVRRQSIRAAWDALGASRSGIAGAFRALEDHAPVVGRMSERRSDVHPEEVRAFGALLGAPSAAAAAGDRHPARVRRTIGRDPTPLASMVVCPP